MILQSVASSVSTSRTRIEFTQTPNGVITSFTTVSDFFTLAPREEWVLYNGKIMQEGPISDYEVAESGGPGTGFDTVNFNFTPEVKDIIGVLAYLS